MRNGARRIAELAVDKFHLKTGIIDDAHIDYLTEGSIYSFIFRQVLLGGATLDRDFNW